MNHWIVSQPIIAALLGLGIVIAFGCRMALTNDVAIGSVGFAPAPVVPLATEGPARLIVDSPLPEQLARGYVVVRYLTENLRIMPVYGPAALGISPCIGHLHITVDHLPWHWLDPKPVRRPPKFFCRK